MTPIRQFIDQLAAGENADAKDTIENVLSTKSFESLDNYKKQIASGIFNNNTDEPVEQQEAESAE